LFISKLINFKNINPDFKSNIRGECERKRKEIEVKKNSKLLYICWGFLVVPHSDVNYICGDSWRKNVELKKLERVKYIKVSWKTLLSPFEAI